jgi:hypothetical protein
MTVTRRNGGLPVASGRSHTRRGLGLTARQAAALREQFGIEIDDQPDELAYPSLQPKSACAICGGTAENAQPIFYGDRIVTICRDCLAANTEGT